MGVHIGENERRVLFLSLICINTPIFLSSPIQRGIYLKGYYEVTF